MNPTLSIIIPIYNAGATLARCMNSVLTQSLREIEVICINDGSTDGSVEILKQFVAHEARLHVYSFEKNFGTVIATKLGLLNAKGKYVMFVDSDDVLLPGACEKLARLIRESGVDVLQFGMKITVQPGTDTAGFEKLIRQEPMTSEGDRILYDCFTLHLFTHNIANKIFRAVQRRRLCRTSTSGSSRTCIWLFSSCTTRRRSGACRTSTMNTCSGTAFRRMRRTKNSLRTCARVRRSLPRSRDS